MKIKTDWLRYLHDLRATEIKRIFWNCPKNVFNNGLEIGSGDGFQSLLLAKYVRHLCSTDYNSARLKGIDNPQITYIACDAEKIDSYFDPKKFDMVFSSNLLEHLPHAEETLRGIYKVLKNDGITIHCMPNPFWKFLQLFLFYPNLFVNIFERLTTTGWLKGFIGKRLKKSDYRLSVSIDFNNNPKMASPGRLRLLYPQVHGAYKNHFKEFVAFRKKRWIKKFEKAKFKVVKIVRCPVASGYGFGLNKLRSILEKAGFSSGYAYVAVKNGEGSPYLRYFGVSEFQKIRCEL